MSEIQPKYKVTKEVLEDMFIRRRLSIKKIAKILKIKSSNTITQYLKKYGLSRPPNTITRFLTKKYLIEQYVVLSKSAEQIAKELGTTAKPSVLKAIKRFGLKRTKLTQSQIKQYENKREDKRFSSRVWSQIKKQAISRKIPFLITIDDVIEQYNKQNGRCILSGLEIKFHEIGEPFCKKTASVDRIDSNKGYEKGNIQIVHKIVNRMKWSLNQKAFIWFCKKIYENNLDINLENSYEDSLY